MKFISLAILLFSTYSLLAQQTIRVIDQETSDPVPGVLVEILDDKSRQVAGSLTDIDGIARFDLKGTFNVRLSHVSYQAVIKQVARGETNIKLAPSTTTLGGVVVTGQYHPQSAQKSVYNVRTVGAETIENQGSVQLQEVLSKQLNIRIAPDMAIGSSGMSLQGIEGQNVKILVDGIPLVGRTGNGNDADLSQINMANIERVEIVEGPMSVDYGANAMAGVINLITKKPAKKSYRIGLDLQGETIAGEYGLNEGNTNINLTSAASISNSFMVSLNGGMTRFGGFQGTAEGRRYQWNPKDQLFYDVSLWYRGDRHNASYKLEQLFETISDPGRQITETQFSTGAEINYAFDSEYVSRRIAHQVQADGKLSDFFRYNFLASYSDFNRDIKLYRADLDANTETFIGQESTNFKAGIIRSTVQNINPDKPINYQFGVDMNFESTLGGRIVGDTAQQMQDYAVFASFEANINRLTIRPGLRGSLNSTFGTWVTPSVNLKYKISERMDLGAAYGNGYRAPSLRELYMEFIDASHTVIGNEDLTPEYSNHYSANIEYRGLIGTNKLTTKAQFFYNDVRDLITFLFDPNDVTWAKYYNLNQLKTFGFNLNESFAVRNFSFDVGGGIIGRKEIDPQVDSPDEFLFSPEVSLNATYKEPLTKLNFNVFYKYNGPASQYNWDDNNELYISQIEGYSLLDVIINRSFSRYLTVGIGGKNLLDITNLQSTSSSGGGNHAAATGGSRSVGFGRSFFVRLSFNLDSNN